jgi:CBS domain containing-hemolysin-like protein
MDYSEPILFILISLLFSAFFSGMEIAFVSANKLKIELDSKQGLFTSKILSKFQQDQKRFIGAMLVGNNIALVVYGIFAGSLILTAIFGVSDASHAAYPTVTLLIQTLISTLVILLTAEFFPKAIFRSDPNRWLNIFAIPLLLCYIILWFPAWIITGISNVFLKVFLKADTNTENVQFGKIDLDHYIKEISQKLKPEDDIDHEIQIFQNALDFSEVKARDCLVPRNELIAVDFNETIEVVTKKFIEHGLSKILIYRGNIDNIIGYVHCNELFKRPEQIKNILLPVSIVPEPMQANEVLELLIKQNRNLAVVVDEFGGTSGIVTIEDVVEEIFGEIEDEHDKEDIIEKEIGEDHYLFSGRIEIDYLNEHYKLDLDEDGDYDTLAGFIIHHHEDIPDEGHVIEVDDLKLTVKKVSETRIELVEVEAL